MVAIEFIVHKPNGSVDRLITLFFFLFSTVLIVTYLTLLWRSRPGTTVASEAITVGLFRPDIFTNQMQIARKIIEFDLKLSDDQPLS